MTRQQRCLTDAYCVGITLRERLRNGSTLTCALKSPDGPFGTLNDRHPDWHPAPLLIPGDGPLVSLPENY
jgi:hypothetical protein